jgi:hypothetical protein
MLGYGDGGEGMTLIVYLFRLALCLVGGLNIRTAIKAFEDGSYFAGGFNIMIAVWMAILMLDTYFGGMI